MGTHTFRFTQTRIQQKLKMPKGGGLTKPTKLSADLLPLSVKTRPAVPNASNSCGLTSRKTTSKTPKTSNTLPPTRRWPRFSVLTVSAPLEWPNSFLLISQLHKWVSKKNHLYLRIGPRMTENIRQKNSNLISPEIVLALY